VQVEFGIWDHFERRPGIPVSVQYQEKIGLVQEAERLGFGHYWVAEHHMSPLDLAPSPSVFLAALAEATSTMRIGTGVYVLPLYHPVRLVQELCMLDNLSDGRLDVGIGRGVRAIEHEWFGVPRDEVRARHNETLAIVTNALATGNMNYDGEFYKFGSLPLDVLPVQRPYPPLWYAGGVESAARAGFNFLTRSAADVTKYWQLWEESRGQPGRVNEHQDFPRVAITRHMVVRESYDEAVAIARRSWPVFESHWFHTPILINEDGRAAPQQPSAGGADFDDALAADRRLLVGTPSMVRERLLGWLDQCRGRPSLFFSPAVQWGDITTPEALETLRLLARDVLPAVLAATRDAAVDATG
jgi:alkanesulfonate monooxygenase SsuD/methylene tetrahydromethanopterin reductase-like flavin-dependent oxidoreductase (luciferase family)